MMEQQTISVDNNRSGIAAIARYLSPTHQALIDGSAIDKQVAAARGYWTARGSSELKKLGFEDYQRMTPALVLPVHGVHGEVASHQTRPDPRRRWMDSGSRCAARKSAGADGGPASYRYQPCAGMRPY